MKQEPEKLAELLSEYALPSSFDLDSFENLVPTSGFPNRQKGASINKIRMSHYLALAQEKAPQVRKELIKLEHSERIDLLQAQLAIVLDQETIPLGEIQQLIDKVKSHPSVIQLDHPIQFADGTQIDRLTSADIDSILDRPILPRVHGLDYLRMVKDNGSKREIVNCREWLLALKEDFYPESNYDHKESAFFGSVASVIWAISRRLPYSDSYVSRGVAQTELLSPLLLPHLSGDEARDLRTLESEGHSLGAILSSKGIQLKTSEAFLSFEIEGMASAFWEVMRGDFSGGGFEEILIKQYERTIEGTYSTVQFRVLSRTKPTGLYEFRNIKDSELLSLL